MSTQSKEASIAATAAFLALSMSANAATNPPGSKGLAIAASDRVHCYGLTFCHGLILCSGIDPHKKEPAKPGDGKYKEMTAKQCLDIGGVIADLVDS